VLAMATIGNEIVILGSRLHRTSSKEMAHVLCLEQCLFLEISDVTEIALPIV
jgi:hypothetical protein